MSMRGRCAWQTDRLNSRSVPAEPRDYKGKCKVLIETDRLYMRPVRESDAQTLYQLHTDPLVVRLTSDGTAMSKLQSKERLDLYLREWQEFHFGFFVIYEKQSNGDLIFVGRCGLRSLGQTDVEIGYCLNTQGTGRGLATEAATQVIHFAFSSRKLKQIVGLTRPANVQSKRILEKLGFCFTASCRYRDIEYLRYQLHCAAK